MAEANPELPQSGHNSKKIDFEKAAKIMRGEVAAIGDKTAKLRGDASAAWKRIEDCGVNKKAAKAVQAMLKQAPSESSDYLRTFIGLLSPLGLGIIRDMVDDAEGKSSISVPLIEAPAVEI